MIKSLLLASLLTAASIAQATNHVVPVPDSASMTEKDMKADTAMKDEKAMKNEKAMKDEKVMKTEKRIRE